MQCRTSCRSPRRSRRTAARRRTPRARAWRRPSDPCGRGQAQSHGMSARVEIDAGDVVLRPLTEDDAPSLVGLLEEPALREWLRAEDADGIRERIRGWASGRSPDGAERWLNWIARRRDGGEAVGGMQATGRDDVAGGAHAPPRDAPGAGGAPVAP